MQKALNALREAKTWDIVKKPPGKNVIGCKWVFRIKKDAQGKIEKYKARLIARGFTQAHGVDYTDTFAPVAKLASIRTILAIAAQNNWPIEVFGFNSAFLNGEFDEDIYMELPPGMEGLYMMEEHIELVAKLWKALYGLNQGRRTWYRTLCQALNDIRFKSAEYDHGALYTKASDSLTILAIHVDDIIITSIYQTILDQRKDLIAEKYKLTDLGPINWLFGIRLTRDCKNRSISLSQSSYLRLYSRLL